MRRIGVLCCLAVFAAGPAAADSTGRCDALSEDRTQAEESRPQPLLTITQCESIETRELRAPLLEVPQDDEDPMQLSLGIKNGGLSLRLKIPFSW